jgi:hypothetical protein
MWFKAELSSLYLFVGEIPALGEITTPVITMKTA